MQHLKGIIRYVLGLIFVFICAYTIVAFLDKEFNLNKDHKLLLVAIGVTLLISFAYYSIMYIIIDNDRSKVRRRLDLAEILYDLLHDAAKVEDEEALYDLVLKAAIKALPNGELGTILDIKNPNNIQYSAVVGFDDKTLSKIAFSLDETYLYRETKGKLDQTIIISNAFDYNKKVEKDKERLKLLIEVGTQNIFSTICTPISYNGEVVGMLNIDSSMRNAFSKEDIAVIEVFSHEVSRMIHLNRLMEDNLYLSRYDSLTKIYNRGYFYELHKNIFFDKEVEGYIYIAMDLNNLKLINDTYGHIAGDKIIQHFAETVSEHIPEGSVFGRYGGDEFNLILLKKSYEEAKKLMIVIEKFFLVNPVYEGASPMFVSFSYGIVDYPNEVSTYKDIIKLGDERMYTYKRKIKLGLEN